MRRSTVSFVLLPAIMRRNISIFLIISILCASLSPSALAVDSECKDMIFITKAPGNEYFMETTNLFASKISAKRLIDFDGIYMTESGQYIQRVANGNYIPVDKVALSLGDSQLKQTLAIYDLPVNIYNDILNMQKLAEATECADTAQAVFFTPPNTRSTMPDETYIDDSGRKFIDRQVYYTNMSTGPQMVEAPSVTKDLLQSLKEITMLGVGFTPAGTAISITETGVTLWDIWSDRHPGVTDITFHNTNYFWIQLRYNILSKFTYYYDEALDYEYLGCTTQKARITQIETETYTFLEDIGGATERTTDYNPDAEYFSTNFDYPYDLAFDHRYVTYTERVSAQIGPYKIDGKEIEIRFTFAWPT